MVEDNLLGQTISTKIQLNSYNLEWDVFWNLVVEEIPVRLPQQWWVCYIPPAFLDRISSGVSAHICWQSTVSIHHTYRTCGEKHWKKENVPFHPSFPDIPPCQRQRSPQSKPIFFHKKKSRKIVATMDTDKILRSTLTEETLTKKGDTKTCLFSGLRYFFSPIRCREHLGFTDSSKQVK